MALSDAIDYLTEVNEKTMEEQELTNLHIEEMTDRITDLVNLNKQDRLERLENLREGAGAFEAPSLTGGDAGAAAGGQRGLGGLIGSLGGLFGLTGFLTSLTAFSQLLLKLFKGVGRFLGPLGLIITAVIATFQTVEGFLKGYEEGGFLGGLEGAVKGFVDSIIAAPLDLLREIVAWIADKLGFKLTAQALRDFSFSELFDSMITSIFDGLQNVVDVVVDIFSFPEDGGPLQNFGNLLDTVMLGVNIAINFIGTIFGFIEPGEPFRLSKFISKQIKEGLNFVTGIFGFEPVDTEQTLMDFLMETFDKVFFSINRVVTDFGNRLLVEGEIVFRKILVFIQNIPDQLMKFISDNLSFKLPMIAIPNPVPPVARNLPGVPKEDAIVIFGGTDEIRVPGGQNAAANIARRNEELQAEIERIRNQSGTMLEQVGSAAGASGGGTTVIQTTNNITQGGGGGGGVIPSVSSSTAAPMNEHPLPLDATQVIGGGAAR
jgi:hypothetical protein